MDNTGKDAAIGFFTTEQTDGIGVTGGYLLLNLSGRPLEFHCTLPVRPTRAHEILYGATLRSHIIGERIAPALLERSRLKPILICIDSPEAAAIQSQLQSPLVMVESASVRNDCSSTESIESVRPVGDDLVHAEAVRRALARITNSLDLAEPFQRIREALREAQQSASRAAA